jgi:ABC-type uncharacterized transport system substrate-binding protein
MKPTFRVLVPFLFTLLAVMLTVGLFSCKTADSTKIVVYVNSYHQGFPPSDQITKGVMENLPAEGIELVSYFMDTKRNPSDAYIKRKSEELFDSITRLEPAVLIVSDDNALKHLVVPYFQDSPLPIVFCGINWTAGHYDLAGCNITGILEILPVRELIQTLKPSYPEMKRILVLNENTTTSRKTKPLLDTLLGNLGLEVSQELVDDFEQWKSVFTEANQSVDLIYLQTRGAIKEWDHDAAIRHIDKHISIPVVTCEDFMMPYAVLGVTQLSKEQGTVAAEMATSILGGTSPGEIPITRNKLSKTWLNTRLAEAIGFQPDPDLVKQSHIVK